MTYPLSRCEFPDDVKRIIQIAADRGVVCSALEAKIAWEDTSESMCAGWLCLPKDDETVWAELPGWFKGEAE